MLIRPIFTSCLIFFLLACNDGEPTGDAIYTTPAYKPVTDSIRRDPSNADLYYKRGLMLTKDNQPAFAMQDLRKAWSLAKKEEYAVTISNVWLDRNLDSALVFLESALLELPGNLFLELNLVYAYTEKNRADDALAMANRILEKSPGQIDALIAKSKLLEKKNLEAESLKALETAYAMAPFDEELAYLLAFKYARNKNPKAIVVADSLISAGRGTRAEPYYFKGVYYRQVGNQEKALQMLDSAIVLDYDFADPHLDKGGVLYDQKKYKEALETFLRVISIDPANPDAYYWTGRCQEAMNQKEEARLNYQRAWGLDKSFTEAKEAADRLAQ